MIGRPGRPASPGFTQAQARKFRSIFRKECVSIGVSNTNVGRAIEDYELVGRADGLTVLQNALSPARKLTHRTARILVAGLFLAAERFEKRLERLGDEFVRIIDGAIDLRFEKQKLALVTLGGAMYAYHAWDPDPAIPAFIPLEAIDHLAGRLAPKRPGLKKALSQKLRADAPAMARAWCERLRRTPIKGSTPQIIDFIERLERLVRAEFPSPQIEPYGLLFSLGSEFEVLRRERPDLTQHFLQQLSRAHSIDARSQP